MLNEGQETTPRTADNGFSEYRRAVSLTWWCGACGKQAKAPHEPTMRFSRKCCDYCLADNLFRV